MGLLSSRPGICLYLLLPNRWVWALLTRRERAQVQRANLIHNTEREDFADPARYCNGNSFDVDVGDAWADRCTRLQEFLDRVRPAVVLEVGPGSGHLTRVIVTHPAVREYIAVDINGAFLDFLRERLQRFDKPGFSFRLICGTVADVPEHVHVDAAILLSTVHHIPDRPALFRTVRARLRPSGRILAIDPTHYVLRWWHLVRKITHRDYLRRALETAQQGRLATHAMCQWSEYRAVARRAGLSILRARFEARPARIERLRARGVPLGPLSRWFAQEIAVELGHERPAYPLRELSAALIAQLAASAAIVLQALRIRM